jgi:hypothetical protein
MLRRWLYLCVVLLLAGFVVPRAHASSSDRVSFFHDIVVSDNEEAEDLVCFLCSIRVDGKVSGDTVAFLGSVHVKGEISGDVVSFLGGVAMGDEARIGGDCVSFGGPLRKGQDASIGGDTVQFPFILLAMPFIVVALLIYGLVAFLRHRKYAAYPMPPRPPMR